MLCWGFCSWLVLFVVGSIRAAIHRLCVKSARMFGQMRRIVIRTRLTRSIVSLVGAIRESPMCEKLGAGG
jgi:hypothetical protein